MKWNRLQAWFHIRLPVCNVKCIEIALPLGQSRIARTIQQQGRRKGQMCFFSSMIRRSNFGHFEVNFVAFVFIFSVCAYSCGVTFRAAAIKTVVYYCDMVDCCELKTVQVFSLMSLSHTIVLDQQVVLFGYQFTSLNFWGKLSIIDIDNCDSCNSRVLSSW